MKVAISFSGLPRILLPCITSWQQLIATYNADVFMHLWDDMTPALYDIYQYFNPTLLKVEPLREYDISLYTDRLVQSNPYNVLSMWTSVQESVSLVNSYSTYDIVVRARLDVNFDNLILQKTNGIVIPGKPPEHYSYNNEYINGWHDMIAYGDQKSISVYGNTIDSIKEYYQSGGPFFSEYFLSKHLYQNQIFPTNQLIYADIVR